MPKRKQPGTTEEGVINLRWTRFLEYYLASGNARESAIQAGFSESYADVITTRLPDKVRKSMAIALEEQGITPDIVAEKIGTLLYAKKQVKVGETVVGEEDDYIAIDKGITQALKLGLGGGYAPDKSQSVVAHVHLSGAEELRNKAQSLANQIADGYRLGKPDGRTDSGDGRGGHPDMAESLPDPE